MPSVLKNVLFFSILQLGNVLVADTFQLARQAARDQMLEMAEQLYVEAVENSGTDRERIQAQVELARTRLRLQDLSGAKEVLEDLPRRIPKPLRGSVDVLKADVFQSEGNYEEAMALLEDIEELPDGWQDLAISLLAHCMVQVQGAEAGLKYLEEQAQQRDSLFLRIEAVLLNRSAGNKEEALAELKTLAEEVPLEQGGARVRIHLAMQYLADQQAEEASSWLKPLVDSGTKSIELEAKLYPILIAAMEQQERFVEAADLIKAFTVRFNDPETIIPLHGREARNRISAGQLDEMDVQLSRWIAQYGDQPALTYAQAALIEAWKEQGNLQKAKTAAQRYLSVVTESAMRVQAEIGLVDIYVELGELDEAVLLAERVKALLPEDHPQYPNLLFNLADAELRRDNPQRSATLFGEWIQQFPKHKDLAPVLFRSSEAYAAAGQVSQALYVLGEVRQQVPRTELAEKALLQRALVLGPKRIEQALGAFDAYLEAYPNGAFVADAMTEKGIAAYRLGLFDLAIREFTDVETTFPDHPRAEQASCLKGWAHYLKGEDDKAEAIGEAFLEDHPDSQFESDVRLWLAEMSYNRGDYEESASEFQSLTDEKYPPAMRGRAAYFAGRSFLISKKVDEALTWFTNSLEINPSSSFAPATLFYMGDALTELDQFDGAIVRFNEVIRLYPSSYLALPALGRIGDCQYTLGEKNPDRYLEALNTYRQVKESTEAPLELKLQAIYKVGRTLAALDRMTEALQVYLEAASFYRAHASNLPGSASIWFVRSVTDAAQHYESQEEYRNAIKVYRQLADTQIDGASEAARRIEDLRRQHLILF